MVRSTEKDILKFMTYECAFLTVNLGLFSFHIDTTPCSSLPVQSLGPQQSDGGMTKKRRKRRRKTRLEAGVAGEGRREESREEFSEEEDMFTMDLSSDEERKGDGSRFVCVLDRFFLIELQGIKM